MWLYHSANPRQARLVSVLLVLLLGVTAFAIPLDNPPTVYKNKTEFYEGDECILPGTPPRTGICRKAPQCPRGVGRNAVHCEFSVHDAVVCCPVSDGKDQSAAAGTNRFMAGVAKQECDGLQSRSATLTDHLSGNRKEAILGEFPFMAHVNYAGEDADDVGCGASLISKRFLLSAAHCFNTFQPVSVTLGAVLKDDPESVDYLVKQVHVHEGYKRRQNDLALIELQRDVTFDSHLSPICLNNGLQDIDTMLNLTVMGWGTDGSGSRTNKLYKGIVNRINLDRCREIYSTAMLTIPATDKIMCALGEKSKTNGDFTDTCTGDSGGPLILSVGEKFYLAGVVSFGTTCGGPIPGIYTRVSHYIDWIEQKVWGGR